MDIGVISKETSRKDTLKEITEIGLTASLKGNPIETRESR